MKKLILFEWYQFLSQSLFLRGPEKQTPLEEFPAGPYRSVIPTLRDFQKPQSVLIFVDVATHSFPEKQGAILHSRFLWKLFKLLKEYCSEKALVVLMDS